MSFRHLQGDFLCVKRINPKTNIDSSEFLPIHQLGQAIPENFVTYLMVTAEVGLPDAV